MSKEKTGIGPVYGQPLIDSLPIGGGLMQAMPSENDLKDAQKMHQRLVAGYEVLLLHYQRQTKELHETKECLSDAMNLISNMTQFTDVDEVDIDEADISHTDVWKRWEKAAYNDPMDESSISQSGNPS
ncbi:MAG: hypothetical protein M0R32_09180 [Candidatus Cloacimonetes bacterium]|jgi:hypothetical protein|nr:hypothetical protein [Candidatus Cloacimonadota bacterium]